MSQDSEAVWRWSGKSPYVLQNGDPVFVSLAKGLPLQFMNSAMNIPENLGLKSRVYQGLERMAPVLTSNLHIEACHELNRSRALFVLCDNAADDWISGKVGDALRRGVIGWIYFLSKSGQQSMTPFDTLFPTRLIRDPEHFSTAFRRDLLVFMGRL